MPTSDDISEADADVTPNAEACRVGAVTSVCMTAGSESQGVLLGLSSHEILRLCGVSRLRFSHVRVCFRAQASSEPKMDMTLTLGEYRYAMVFLTVMPKHWELKQSK